MNDNGHYCNATPDAAKMFGLPRSPQWPAVRRAWLKRQPFCIACGTDDCLEVHHCEPVHINPARELDETNLVTLCETPGLNCHLFVGHISRWDWYWPLIQRTSFKTVKQYRRGCLLWLLRQRKMFIENHKEPK